MKNLLLVFLLILLVFPALSTVCAADLEFDSFEAAEAASQKRSQEYKQKMDEHMKNMQDEWEQQQKDLGSDNSSPDISKITSSSDGQKSSDTDAAAGMENAVNSSVNNLKNTMINTAGPNSTGFAGAGAGYQWSVKYVGGKYVLSDSYNEADFNTGKKKPKPTKIEPQAPPKSVEGEDKEEIAISKAPEKPTPTTSEPADSTSEPKPTQIANVPKDMPSSTSTPGSSSPADPGSSGTSGQTCKPGEPCSSDTPTPGVDPAPANLPPPDVKLVIQHPIDFREDSFSSNTDSKDPTSYELAKFRIPEDTRVKIAIEVSNEINPDDVSLVIVDEEGEQSPVSASKMGNYRHMFRVPSEDKYSANVYVVDKDKPGNRKKKLMQVKIPVSKVDFESRTIDNQRGTKTGDGSNSSAMSSTSSSGSSGSYSHSSFGQPQQVDLSDLYSEPGSELPTAGSGSAGPSGSSSSGSAGSAGSVGSAGSAGDSEAAGNMSSGSGNDVSTSSARSGSSSKGASGSSTSDSNSYTGQSSSAGNNQGDASQDAGANNTYADAGDASGNSNNGSSYGNSSNDATAGTDGYNNGAGAGSSYDNSNTDYSSNDASNADTQSGSDTGYSDAAQNGGNEANNDSAQETSENGYQNAQYASAQGLPSSSNTLKGRDSSNTVSESKLDDQESVVEEDNFVMAVALRSEAHKIYQSFDFIDQAIEKSTTLPAGSEIIFSLSLGKLVDPESISIKMGDGAQEFSGNLKTMGESFAYSFQNASPDSYIEVSGRSGKNSFTYRLTTPVVKK